MVNMTETNNIRLEDFNYELPQRLIAQFPAAKRDESRLLIVEKTSGRFYEDKFGNLPNYIDKEDLLVFNNSKVIPARLIGYKETGAKIELFLLEESLNNIFKVLAKPSKRLKEGTTVIFEKGQLKARVLGNADIGKLVQFNFGGLKFQKILNKIGKVPLPPYIKREPVRADKVRYQTIYAKKNGSCAAPTAGLHFTKELFGKLKKNGINFAWCTLHVNYATFAPIDQNRLNEKIMYKEYFEIPKETAGLIQETKKAKKRVVSVGTTTTRALESLAAAVNIPTNEQCFSGNTNLFIYPPYNFKMVDALITNFHLPMSSLLMLVSAFAGRELILDAYKYAVKNNFRFFSYGDAMLVL